MPAFSQVKVSRMQNGTSVDLAPYLKLIEDNNTPGTRITLPLEKGDRPRVVMRHINKAADQMGARLRRIPTAAHVVEVVVMNPEKRPSSLTPEQMKARGEKIRASMLARKQQG